MPPKERKDVNSALQINIMVFRKSIFANHYNCVIASYEEKICIRYVLIPRLCEILYKFKCKNTDPSAN